MPPLRLVGSHRFRLNVCPRPVLRPRRCRNILIHQARPKLRLLRFDVSPRAARRLAPQRLGKARALHRYWPQRCRIMRTVDFFPQVLDFGGRRYRVLARPDMQFARGAALQGADRAGRHRCRNLANIVMDRLTDRRKKILHSRFCSHSWPPHRRPATGRSGNRITRLPESCRYRRAELFESFHIRAEPLVANPVVVLFRVIDGDVEIEIARREMTDGSQQLIGSHHPVFLGIDQRRA